MRHYASRGLLGVLTTFIAITAIAGAILVVPTLPPEWLEGSVLDDYAIPAFALGLVGGLAAVTLVALAVRPDVAGLAALVTGVAMVAFELVEIAVVGFSLLEYGVDEPVAWLQVVYLVVGALTAGAGFALWRATAEDRERTSPPVPPQALPRPEEAAMSAQPITAGNEKPGVAQTVGQMARWIHDPRLPGVLVFVQAAQFMTVIMLAASMAPGYDFGGGAISDLGVIPETATLFNVSLVLTGLLNLAAGSLLYLERPGRWLLAVYVAAGVGAIGAGLVPLNSGDAHSLFALAAFLFFNVQAIASSRLVAGPMAAISVLAGVVGLIFVVIMVIGDSGNPAVFGPIGHGGAERMIVYPVMLWLLAFGGYLMGRPHVRVTRDS